MDYANGKIYCIRSYQTDNIYIGSTTQSLSKRLSYHKNNYKAYLNKKYHYVTSFEIIKYDDAYIELIELYPCSCKDELTKKEGEHIRNIKCINKIIVGRTQKEYYEYNKDKIKIYKKEYYEDNKEQLLKKQKEYREKNKDKINKNYDCECGGSYTYNHRSCHLKTKKHLDYLKEQEELNIIS